MIRATASYSSACEHEMPRGKHAGNEGGRPFYRVRSRSRQVGSSWTHLKIFDNGDWEFEHLGSAIRADAKPDDIIVGHFVYNDQARADEVVRTLQDGRVPKESRNWR
jgi:hypothetical protein